MILFILQWLNEDWKRYDFIDEKVRFEPSNFIIIYLHAVISSVVFFNIHLQLNSLLTGQFAIA